MYEYMPLQVQSSPEMLNYSLFPHWSKASLNAQISGPSTVTLSAFVCNLSFFFFFFFFFILIFKTKKFFLF